jgi:hypothetical protein
MRVQNFAVIVMAVLTGILLTACQKKPVEQALHAAEINHPSVSTNRQNLGVLSLSNHISTTITLPKNKECTITPTLLDGGDLQIILTMETKGTDGKTESMNVTRVINHSGEPFDVSISDMNLAFTPRLVANKAN